MTVNSSVLAIRVSSQTVRIQLQPMRQSVLTNSPPSRFSGTTLTSDNTLSLKLDKGYLPVPTNILVRDFKKFRYGQELPWLYRDLSFPFKPGKTNQALLPDQPTVILEKNI